MYPSNTPLKYRESASKRYQKLYDADMYHPVTAEELASYANTSIQTIYGWIHELRNKGLISTVSIGSNKVAYYFKTKPAERIKFNENENNNNQTIHEVFSKPEEYIIEKNSEDYKSEKSHLDIKEAYEEPSWMVLRKEHGVEIHVGNKRILITNIDGKFGVAFYD